MERELEAEWSCFDQLLWNSRTDVVWVLEERFAPVDGRVEGVEERLGVEEVLHRVKTNPWARGALEEEIEAAAATARLGFSLDDALADLREQEEVEKQESALKMFTHVTTLTRTLIIFINWYVLKVYLNDTRMLGSIH